MSREHDFTALETHYGFGANWRSYASAAHATALEEAVAGLSRLLDSEALSGKRVLDLGCGSGIHSVAAAVLGAEEVVGIDIDPASVETARAVQSRLLPGRTVRFEVGSVFDLDPIDSGTYDIVYSWGVLHHTGDLHRALERAASLVAPGGVLVIALYRRTVCCPAWTREKRWYTHADDAARKRAEWLYIRAVQIALWLSGRRLSTYMATYQENRRGMDFLHDVRDWLGGFPYESLSEPEVDARLAALGFRSERRWVKADVISRLGLLGSGCDEYVFRRT